MHHGLDRDRVAGFDDELRLLARVEPAPLDRLERRREVVMLALRDWRRPLMIAARWTLLLRNHDGAGERDEHNACGDFFPGEHLQHGKPPVQVGAAMLRASRAARQQRSL